VYREGYKLHKSAEWGARTRANPTFTKAFYSIIGGATTTGLGEKRIDRRSPWRAAATSQCRLRLAIAGLAQAHVWAVAETRCPLGLARLAGLGSR
jgi:hypothetical protein